MSTQPELDKDALGAMLDARAQLGRADDALMLAARYLRQAGMDVAVRHVEAAATMVQAEHRAIGTHIADRL